MKKERSSGEIAISGSDFLKEFKGYTNSKSEDSDVSTQELGNFSLFDEIYSEHSYQPLWITDNMPNTQSGEMLELLSHARRYGLEPHFYHLIELEGLRRNLLLESDPERTEELSRKFEGQLTNSSLLFMSHLKNGVLKTDSLLVDGRFFSVNQEFPQILNRVLRNQQFNELEELQPSNDSFHRLQHAVKKYLEGTHLDDAKVEIPDPAIDEKGCSAKSRQILVSKGYLSNIDATDSLFVIALKKFQKDFGLNQDGEIGENTRKALAMTSYDKYLLMAINLERLKGEHFPDSSYALINVPSYDLKVFEKNKIRRTFRVIVGTSWTKTPNITSHIDQVVTHPIWRIPRSIAVWEILPRLKRDSDYLKGRDYYFYDENKNPVDPFRINWDTITRENFNYRIVQARGGTNPLGEVKFNFPSPFSIYLHDTHKKELFNRELRSFSHGCIRLENPDEFLEYLLSREDNSAKRDSLYYFLRNHMGGEFDLERPLKFYVRYFTCLADSNQKVHFYRDIYGRDEALIDRFLKSNSHSERAAIKRFSFND